MPIVRDREPLLVLAPNSAVGMDVAGGLSGATGLALAAFASGLALDGGSPLVTCQLYSGKIEVRVRFGDGRGICTVVAGAFPASAGRVTGSPTVESIARRAPTRGSASGGSSGRRPATSTSPASRSSCRSGGGSARRTTSSWSRRSRARSAGAVSSSRPIADAGWLPRTRQVGKSGLRVKPKLYLALGISGAPEHLEGMRDAELIIAINTDPRAPIFGVAHYGAVTDLLDVVPALTARLG